MKTFVEFRSQKFPSYPQEEEDINPGIWGKRLAEYLVQKITQQGLQPLEIIPEDWGYYIPIQMGNQKLALCCGHQNGDSDQFFCFTDPRKPKVKKLFRTIDLTSELNQLIQAIDTILKNDPDIYDIKSQEP